jgi:cytochrome c2
MPTTEATRYNLRLLHKLFAAASVVLLVATIWLLIKDHRREWRAYQSTANQIDCRMTEWRKHQYETDAALREQQRLQSALDGVPSQGLDIALVRQFRDAAQAAAKQTGEPLDWARLDGDCDRLQQMMESSRGDAADAEARARSFGPLRQKVLEQLRTILERAKFHETSRFDERQAKSSDLDAAKANVALAIRGVLPPRDEARWQSTVDRLQQEVQELTLHYQAAKEHRENLQGILAKLTAPEDELRRALADRRAAWERLTAVQAERRTTYINWSHGFPLPGKKLLELPLFDAFNPPLKIETLWCNELTQDINFQQVRRFDRCTTCHQAMQKTQPGSAAQPAYPCEQTLQLALTPEAGPRPSEAAVPAAGSPDETAADQAVESVLGLRLAETGLLREGDVAVSYVRPGSPAAKADLRQPPAAKASGAELIAGVLNPQQAKAAPAAEPGLQVGDVLVDIDGVTVRNRGDAISRLAELAGQSDAASPADAAGKRSSPMTLLTVRRGLPRPYASHPRLDLFVGSQSPHKMNEFGCTVCHNGQGSATEFKWASHTPDSESQRRDWRRGHGWFDNRNWQYPMSPRRFTESACLKCHHEVVDLEPSTRFPDSPAPRLLRGHQLIRKYGCYGCHEINGYEGTQRVGPDLRLEPHPAAAAREQGRQDVAPPGRMRRVGPSLRSVAHKLDADFLHAWLTGPRQVRPTTSMPQFFFQWNHLAEGSEYEAVEIRALVAFLGQRTQPFEYLRPPVNITPCATAEQVARGKILFQTRGCLACHEHQDFPDAKAQRNRDDILLGQDLSGLAAKLRGENGRRWLYSWIRQPTRYAPRTRMPAQPLDPLTQKDSAGKVVAVTDPADDIAAYLLATTNSTAAPQLRDQRDRDALNRLVKEHLRDSFTETKAEQYAASGIPQRLHAGLKPTERELLVADERFDDGQTQLAEEQKLLYVGRKTITKLGCFGCHDIPGFEDAKPIGVALADWGRKDPALLAFENIVPYLTAATGVAGPRDIPDDFYLHHIRAGNRIGFIYQKLTEPRSYDYRTVQNKRYNERLRMPQFPLSVADREAIMTFVLGLVAQPPRPKYVYQPNPRMRAILDGRRLLEEYQCRGCHMLEADRWHIAFPPGTFRAQNRKPAFPFADHRFPDAELTASQAADRRGLRHGTLTGMPVLGVNGKPLVSDDRGDDLEADDQYDPGQVGYFLQLWKPAALEGLAFQAGEAPLAIPARVIVHQRPADGGFLARYLLPHVARLERAVNPNAAGSEAWGWLPPSLAEEGRMVQTAWLHDYLLEPRPIRPAAVLQMPRYALSQPEASQFVSYFAAVADVLQPYEFTEQRSPQYLAAAEQRYQQLLAGLTLPSARRFDHALRIVVGKQSCVKCHLVADFDPDTSARAKAPNLAEVYRRLRPDYVRQWIAKPGALRPYTPMPVNITYDPAAAHLGGLDQNLYHGTSVEQLDALVDLLLNFDQYRSARTPIAPLITGAAQPAAQPPDRK